LGDVLKDILSLFVVLVGMMTGSLAQNRQIVVQAVDGRSGKPLANQRLLVFGGDSARAVRRQEEQYVVVTDNGGLATLTLTPETQWLQVWIDWHVLCLSEPPNSKSFPVADIMATGLNTPNTCSSVSQKATPGHLVVFARPMHFWEKMRE
jgi:hypothetical protein